MNDPEVFILTPENRIFEVGILAKPWRKIEEENVFDSYDKYEFRGAMFNKALLSCLINKEDCEVLYFK